MVENWAELCSSVGYQEGLLSDELRYLAKGTSKQTVEGAAWCLLAVYSKM